MFTRKAKLAIVKGILIKKSPIYVQFAVTGECNLNCKICRSSESRSHEKNLSLSEIDKLTTVLSELKVGIVVLTGGEPFLRDDLAEIINRFIREGFTVRLQTNGLLASEKKIKEVVKAGLREVTVSLDSLSSEKQNEIYGDSGSWQQRIEAIASFSNLLPKQGTMLGINTVVSRYNLEDVPKIIEFTTRIGFYSSLIPVHVSSNNHDFVIRRNASDFRFSAKDHSRIDEVFTKIEIFIDVFP